MFYDTHVHFEHVDGADGMAALVARAGAAGVAKMVAVGASPGLNAHAVEAARRFPGVVEAAIGLDRDQAQRVPSAKEACDSLRGTIEALREEGLRLSALGEIGLDLHYSPETAPAQIALFRAELELARELALPVIVHSREADRETLAALAEHAAGFAGQGRLGVLHCFAGSREFALQLLVLGFHISFSGILTFRNADALRAVAQAIPDDRLLIETDTPWLTPVPHRGKRNEPAYVGRVADCLAAARGVSVERIAELTTRNARRLFEG